ncbi:MAG: energy transducer TonB [Maricaulis sp.]|jgi:tetratricopeptide (TPR) repeat protein|uniref:energy transducer TonB n=1 Tax=Maricaulis sp. TaxID=1486257 RepID=UPI001AFF7E4A|nr:energy transducer TonB [Maricaulis sp.]MBO6730309.1 energy transducer TonB [Maricaulis sp.]MBO6848251.1 energy transducer TonB [Maricaulis sp.]MBO6877976.1 energy transducer TonB [Maricaulis sp.]
MRQFSVFGLVVASVLLLSAPGQSQGLPPAVAEPYLRYQQAQEAGDLRAAQAAAGEAYNAAMANGLDRATQGVLAEVYGYLAGQNGDLGIAFDVLRTAARIAVDTGAPASDRAWRWSLAADAAEAFGQGDSALSSADAALSALAERPQIAPQDRPIAADMQYLRMRILRGRGSVAAAGEAADRAVMAFRADQRELDGRYGLMFYSLGEADYAAGRWARAEAHYRMALALLTVADASEDTLWTAWSYAEISGLLAASTGDELLEHPQPDIHAELASHYTAAANRLERRDLVQQPGFQDVELVSAPAVIFPAAAGEAGGMVVVRFDVDRSGQPDNLDIVFEQPGGLFAVSAREAIAQREYAPARFDGQAVARPGLVQLIMFADGVATAAGETQAGDASSGACRLLQSDWRSSAELAQGGDQSCLRGQGDTFQRGYRGEDASNQCPDPSSCGGQ